MHDFIQSLAFIGKPPTEASARPLPAEPLRGIMSSFDPEPAAYRPGARPARRAGRKMKSPSRR